MYIALHFSEGPQKIVKIFYIALLNGWNVSGMWSKLVLYNAWAGMKESWFWALTWQICLLKIVYTGLLYIRECSKHTFHSMNLYYLLKCFLFIFLIFILLAVSLFNSSSFLLLQCFSSFSVSFFLFFFLFIHSCLPPSCSSVVIPLSSSYFFPFSSCLFIHCYFSSFIYSLLSAIKGTILHGSHSSSTCGVFDRKETTPCNVFTLEPVTAPTCSKAHWTFPAVPWYSLLYCMY